jgi:hypothetical protein
MKPSVSRLSEKRQPGDRPAPAGRRARGQEHASVRRDDIPSPFGADTSRANISARVVYAICSKSSWLANSPLFQ